MNATWRRMKRWPGWVVLAAVVIALLAVGPVWDDVVAFFNQLPQYWDEFTASDAFENLTSTAGADDEIRQGLEELAAGLPEAANAILGIAGGIFGSVLSLVTLTFLALFLLMERPTITDWIFGFTGPAVEARWRPILEESILAVSSSLLGVVGAILAVPFAAVIKIILREASGPRRARMEALRSGATP